MKQKKKFEIFNKNTLAEGEREKDLPFKTHFIPSRYLNRLSRYKVSKV